MARKNKSAGPSVRGASGCGGGFAICSQLFNSCGLLSSVQQLQVIQQLQTADQRSGIAVTGPQDATIYPPLSPGSNFWDTLNLWTLQFLGFT